VGYLLIKWTFDRTFGEFWGSIENLLLFGYGISKVYYSFGPLLLWEHLNEFWGNF
jgi:hypothetical protein